MTKIDVIELEEPRVARAGLRAARERERSEERALRALIERESLACEGFWREYSPFVRGLLRGVMCTSDDDHIEDVLQEVFLKVFEILDRVESPGALRSFVGGVTINCARNARRRRSRWSWRFKSSARGAPEPSADSSARQSFAIDRLNSVMARMSPDLRAVLVMRLVEQMEIAEIASALAISESTVKRRFRKAKDLLDKWSSRDPWLREYAQDQQEGL